MILNTYKSKFPYCSFNKCQKELLIINKQYALDYGLYKVAGNYIEQYRINVNNLKGYFTPYPMVNYFNSALNYKSFFDQLKPGAIFFTGNVNDRKFGHFKEQLTVESFSLNEIGFGLDKYYFVVDKIKPVMTKSAIKDI
jgi:hypothetical protein